MMRRRERKMEIEERERSDEDETGEGFSGSGLSGVSWFWEPNLRGEKGGCVTGHVRHTPGWRAVTCFARLGEKKRAGPIFFYLGWFPFFKIFFSIGPNNKRAFGLSSSPFGPISISRHFRHLFPAFPCIFSKLFKTYKTK